MACTLTARIERFPVRGSFVIARGAKTHVDVAVAEIEDGRRMGRGEATAIYYRGESAENVVAAIAAQADSIAAGASRADLLALMPAGAARNAVDAAPRPPASASGSCSACRRRDRY
jgi:L-Ala-D/L-Glu epimerase